MNTLFALFRKPSAKAIALQELAEAERQLLTAQATAEYGTSMTSYHSNRIRRLQKFLQETS